MFVSVAETNVGSLLCFGVGVVQSLFNFFLFLCVCITSFRDCTRPKHQKTTPESLMGESAKKYGKIPFNQKEKKEKKRKDKFSHETRFFCHKTTEVNICEIYTILWTTVRLRPYQ